MTNESPEDQTFSDDESEAQRRFQETLGRLVNTPPKPHKPKQAGEVPPPKRKLKMLVPRVKELPDRIPTLKKKR